MRCFTRASIQVKKQFTLSGVKHSGEACTRPRLVGCNRACPRRHPALLPILLAITCAAACPAAAQAQDSGSKASEFFGNGAEIVVTVYDGSGDPISAPAMVQLYREGSISSGQGATSHGRMSFIVTSLGEFTLVVEAPGYPRTEKEVSVRDAVRTPVDVYLRRAPEGETTIGMPGKPILAPKAKQAFDKGLRALSANQLREAEKFVGVAVRLAPGHPDVLYVQGVLCLKQQNWVQAQSVLEKATQMDPGNARAFAALGMALSDQGKYDAAIPPLEKSLSLDPGVGFETHWALGRAYYQVARYEEALRSAKAALVESNGKAPEIALLVAQALTAVGKYEDAADTLRGFLREHGDRPEAGKARRWLERLRTSGKIGAG